MAVESGAGATWAERLESRAERLLVLLNGYAKVTGFVLLVAFIVTSWADLRALLPRLTHFKALGVELEVNQLAGALEKQVKSTRGPKVELQPADVEAVLARALRVQSVFEGATILWVDDDLANNLPFRRLLRALGAAVEPARSNEEALRMAQIDTFDLIISDIGRPNNENGIDGLKGLRAAGLHAPAIFYVFEVDPSRPVPGDALGITNRPDVLLHLVIDGLERSRWSRPASPAEPPVGAEGRGDKTGGPK